MSGNQTREVRRSGRSGSSGHHRGFSGGGGKGGGGGAAAPPLSGQPPLSSSRSFKKPGNSQGGPPRPNQSSTVIDASAGFAPAPPPQASLNGSQLHSQSPSHGQSNAPPQSGGEKPVNMPPPRNLPHSAPQAPPSQPAPKVSNSSPSSATPKGDQSKGAFPLQFGTINPGIMNGLQIPARTSSAPPNLDEQKRNQALHDAMKAAPKIPPPSVPKPQPPQTTKKETTTTLPGPTHSAQAQSQVQTQSHPPPPQPKRDLHMPAPPAPAPAPSVPLPVATGPAAPPRPPPPAVLSMAGMQVPVPFQHQQPQVQLQFGPHNPQIQPPGVVPSSLQMPMTLPMGSAPQVPQQMFIQQHTLQQQALLHQGQGMAFAPPAGHQLGPPQLGSLAMGGIGGPQYPPPQQQPVAAKFGGPRKTTVKITHPDTHEEVKLDAVSSGQRSIPNIQNIPTFPGPQMGYYSAIPPNSYNTAGLYFPNAPNVPLTSNQMPGGSQQPRYTYPVSQAGQSMTFMNPPSVMNPNPIASGNKPLPINTTTIHSHGVSDGAARAEGSQLPASSAAPVQITSRPTVTISMPPGKAEAPKLLRPVPSEESATGPHRQKEGDIKTVVELVAKIAPVVTPAVSTQQILSETPSSTPVDLTSDTVSVPAGSEGKKRESVRRADSFKDQQKKTNKKDIKNVQQQPQLDLPEDSDKSVVTKEDGAAESVVKLESPTPPKVEMSTSLESETAVTAESTPEVTGLPSLKPDSENESNGTPSSSLDVKPGQEEKPTEIGTEKTEVSGEAKIHLEKPTPVDHEGGDKPQTEASEPARPTSSASSVSTDTESISSISIANASVNTNGRVLESAEQSGQSDSSTGSSVKPEPKLSETRSMPKDKPVMEVAKTKPATGKKKKKIKEMLSKADAAGAPDLYNAYKGPEEKQEIASPSDIGSTPDLTQLTASEQSEKEVTPVEEEAQSKAELDDWEDVADVSTPKLPDSELGDRPGSSKAGKKLAVDDVEQATGTKKYTRDFLLKFAQQCMDLPVGLSMGPEFDVIMSSKSYVIDREPHPSPGRSSRGDRRTGMGIGMGMQDEGDRWVKSPGPYSPSRDLMNGPSPTMNLRSGQGVTHGGMLRNPRGQPTGPFMGGILSGPMMQPVGPQGGLPRSGSDMDRWQHTGIQRGLIPAPVPTPNQVMHRAERKYEVGKVSDAEEAKQRQLKAILNKLTPQNFEKLFTQVQEVNIDNPITLQGVISQIFDKALMEPTFCEMYADFCSQLAPELPDFFNEENEKITFRRLLLNKCQEEFERGEREQAEADKTEEEGEIKQTKEEREQKRLRARRRMLGNIRLIGELYKKRMLTERIMHDCIQQLLGIGQSQNPDEEDIESLCKLMSTIGEMIDHAKAKEHMDAYFDMMLKLSTNQKLSSRVRFMLKDAIDLRKNKWQQRRKVEGPKKIEEVHRDAAQERQLQTSRLAGRGGGGPPAISPSISRRSLQAGLASSPITQQQGLRGLPPGQTPRGYGLQDVRLEDGSRVPVQQFERTVSLPLRPNRDDSGSITLGPQGGLARGMSIRGHPSMPYNSVPGPNGYNNNNSNINSNYNSPSSNDWTSYNSRLASTDDRNSLAPMSWNSSGSQRPGSSGSQRPGSSGSQRPGSSGSQRPGSSGSQRPGSAGGPRAGLVGPAASSSGGQAEIREEVVREKSISAICEFYSAKDEKEVALCIEELNAPNFYHSIISTWVSDSFERKDMEREMLNKLLVNLCKPRHGLFNQDQIMKGFGSVLSTLEDAVNDAPRAPEFLGRIFAKFIAEKLLPLREIGRLIREGSEEPGYLIETGLGGDVLGCTLESIKMEKGDSYLSEIRAGSNLRLEDFRPAHPIRSKKLEAFL